MSQAWDFRRVAGPFEYTEGPVWVGDEVVFTETASSSLLGHRPGSGAIRVVATGTSQGTGLAVGLDGRLLGCEAGDARRIVRHLADDDREMLADSYGGKRLNSPNDLAVDALGRIWFTDPRYGDRTGMELDHESVYRLDPDAAEIVRVTTDTVRPNGIAIAHDQQTVYVAESPHDRDKVRQLRAYPILADGSLGKPLVLHDFGPHRGVDGMTLDADGLIVATCGSTESGPGPRIAVFTSDGEVVAEHPVPADPTNCIFGDDDLRTLYVTTKDGCLYAARTDLKGTLR